MGFLGWMAIAGGVLLTMALSSAYVQRMPISSSIVYLALGFALGPHGFGLLDFDIARPVSWFDGLTQVAVIVSLFIGGLKLRVSFRDPAWRAPVILAGPVMIVCIAGMAAFAHVVLGLDLAMSLLVGAILAPTDPVLAGAVSVAHAADKNRMRYALSGEAGLNDGTAFPFVVLALEWGRHGGPGVWLASWAVHRLVWAVAAGLGIGLVLGDGIGRAAIWLRSRTRDPRAPSDFLALALIALSFVAAELVGAWGFLAVFAAGVGLRRAEMTVVARTPHPDLSSRTRRRSKSHPPAEHLVAAHEPVEHLKEPAVAAGALVAETLSFGDTAERMLEVLLVVLVGAGLGRHFSTAGVGLALFLMIALRPAVVALSLARSPVPKGEHLLVGWFGLRGIGSLFYLAYALGHGVRGPIADELCALTLSAVATSIVVHGITAQPLLERARRRADPSSLRRPRATSGAA